MPNSTANLEHEPVHAHATGERPPISLTYDYPSQVFPHGYRPPEYLAYLERAAGAIKTVRIIIFALIGAFLMLSVFGFYLIYHLAYDVHRMVDQSVRMTEQMQAMSRIMANMHDSFVDMRSDVGQMRGTMGEMNGSMTSLAGNVNAIANTVALIQHSARNLDQSLGPAAGVMNSFMPWGGGGGYPGAPPAAPFSGQ